MYTRKLLTNISQMFFLTIQNKCEFTTQRQNTNLKGDFVLKNGLKRSFPDFLNTKINLIKKTYNNHDMKYPF